MYKMIKFIGWFWVLVITPVLNSHAGALKEVFAVENILPLCAICEKIGGPYDSSEVSALSRFLYHNDRDFSDCCRVFQLCKTLSDSSVLENKVELQGIKCIRYVLAYLHTWKAGILSGYRDKLDESDYNFIEKLDILPIIKKIKEIEQKEEDRKVSTSSPCNIF